MVDRLLRASRPHNKAVVELGAKSGVAAMALTTDGGRTNVGSSLDLSSTDTGRENKDTNSARLSRAVEGQKAGKNKKLTRKEKAVEVASEIRECGCMPGSSVPWQR